MTLSEHMRTKIVSALESIPAGDRADIYVVSLYVSDIDDDPRRPTITIGFNSERQAAACTPAPGQEPKWPIATDAAEARWNYAFWLQNSLAVIGDEETDPVGAEAREAWAKQQGFWYSDEEEKRDFGAALKKARPKKKSGTVRPSRSPRPALEASGCDAPSPRAPHPAVLRGDLRRIRAGPRSVPPGISRSPLERGGS